MTGYLSHKLMQYYLASQIKDDASLYLVKEAYTWSICNFLKESIKFTSTTYCLRSSMWLISACGPKYLLKQK